MMVILYQSTPETKRILDDLLATGKYKDYSEIIGLAVMNLAVLQNELEQSGSFFHDDGSAAEALANSISVSHSDTFSSKHTIRKTRADYWSGNLTLFDFPKKATPPKDAPSIGAADPPADQLSIDRWIFGQHNRLLPIKASCRAMANLLESDPDGLLLDKVSPDIAKSAAELGAVLRSIDNRYGLKRGDALATAFPSEGKRKHSSLDRYVSQFIGQITRDGRLTGLPADLKLLDKPARESELVILTEAGWEFALLKNPVLDKLNDDLPSSLSQEERDYLINHISSKVPVEKAAYTAIVESIRSGFNTPTQLDDALRSTMSNEKLVAFGKSFLSSQRSGAVSRMADLGILERERDGAHVKYTTLPSSDQFVEK
ncbi:MAG: hypothetical protein ACC700_12225 [Anaerolineales bacterium]